MLPGSGTGGHRRGDHGSQKRIKEWRREGAPGREKEADMYMYMGRGRGRGSNRQVASCRSVQGNALGLAGDTVRSFSLTSWRP